VPNTNDEIQRQRLARAILLNCVEKHGGVDALAKHLGVDRNWVIDWVGGKAVPSVEIVRKAAEPFIVIKES
jgi:transcriptional regulator with XRE-family HTH domain